MLHTVLASLGLAICVALAVHMALPMRTQYRVDGLVQRLLAWCAAQVGRVTGWRRHQRQTRAATLEAERVIRRAREAAQQGRPRPDGEWDGNVYRPRNFDKPKKPH
jgi:hypothetical protein